MLRLWPSALHSAIPHKNYPAKQIHQPVCAGWGYLFQIKQDWYRHCLLAYPQNLVVCAVFFNYIKHILDGRKLLRFIGIRLPSSPFETTFPFLLNKACSHKPALNKRTTVVLMVHQWCSWCLWTTRQYIPSGFSLVLKITMLVILLPGRVFVGSGL